MCRKIWLQSRPGVTQGEVQGRVEDGVSCRNADGGPEELCEVTVVGDVVHDE